jgi:chromate transport protein ChrA
MSGWNGSEHCQILMKLVVFTAPAILCAIIAFPALLTSARKEHNWPQALLCAFLPACFLLLAPVLIRMNRDLSRLRRRVARLEGKNSPAGHHASGQPSDGPDALNAEEGPSS